MGYFRFFFQTRIFFRPVSFTRNKKKLTKKSFKLLFMKGKKFHGDSVKNESARAKKLQEWVQNSPPTACLGLS